MVDTQLPESTYKVGEKKPVAGVYHWTFRLFIIQHNLEKSNVLGKIDWDIISWNVYYIYHM